MDKEEILGVVGYLAMVFVVVACVWGAGKLFADSVSDYEVIKPKEGIECIVVSRMFNTSVDCWKEL